MRKVRNEFDYPVNVARVFRRDETKRCYIHFGHPHRVYLNKYRFLKTRYSSWTAPYAFAMTLVEIVTVNISRRLDAYLCLKTRVLQRNGKGFFWKRTIFIAMVHVIVICNVEIMIKRKRLISASRSDPTRLRALRCVLWVTVSRVLP